eukprot:4565009-Prymnesium_polylepis.1
MREATAADYMQAAAGPGGRAAAGHRLAHRHPGRRRTALSPRMRADRGQQGRVSQPPPLGAAAATPRARATRWARATRTCTWTCT